MSWFRCLLLAGCFSLLPGWGGQVRAQAPDPAPAARPAEPIQGPAELPGGTPRPGDIIFLPDSSGKAVPVPYGASLMDYLRGVRRRAGTSEGSATARFAVSAVRLTGELGDEWARLSVEVTVRVLVDNEWVRIPLGMSEGLLRESQHIRPQPVRNDAAASEKASPTSDDGSTSEDGVIEPWDQPAGNAALLRGLGEHRLNLELSVPVRKSPNGRRIQLGLPPAAVSTARLRLKSPGAQVRAADRTEVRIDDSTTGTIVEATGLGTRLDLSWQATMESGPTEVRWEVFSQTLVNFVEGSTALVDITQRLQPVGGTAATQLDVRLPSGCELTALDGAELAEWTVSEPDGQQVRIRLRRAATGPIELRWTLRLRGSTAELASVAGLQVERAIQQTGVLAIAASGDARISAEGTIPSRLQRVGVSDLPPALRHPQLALAFRTLGGEWTLPVRLVPTTPFVAVEPEVRLVQRDAELEFQVRVKGRVYRSGVSQLRFVWPEVARPGWAVDIITGGLALDGETVAGSDEAGGQIRFPEPVRNEFDLRFRARGPVPAGVATITLPRFVVDEQAPTMLTVVAGESQSVRIEPGKAVSVRRLRTPERADERSLESGQRILGAYLVEAPDRIQLDLSTTTEPPAIDVDSTLELSGVERRLAITQRFRYRISHGRLGRLKFQTPPGEAFTSWTFFGPDGRELTPEAIPADAETAGKSVGIVTFPPGQILADEFTIEARYTRRNRGADLPVERGAIVVPLLRAGDVAHHGCQLVWRMRGGDGLSLSDAAWQFESETESTRTWRTVSTPDTVTAQYERVVPDYWRRVSVSRAWLSTEVEMDGTLRTHAHYRVVNCPAAFPVTLPPEARLIAVRWNGQTQPLPAPVSVAASGDQFLLSAPLVGGDQLLTLDYEVRPVTALTFTDELQIEPVRFARELWIAQLYWQLILPDSQHLLTLPEGWTSQNEWRFDTWLFGRRPVMTQQQLEEWVGLATNGGPSGTVRGERLERVGHRYLFTGGSIRKALAARTMSRSVLVLVGAGSALVLGFVLVQVRQTRTVFTFLLLAFLLAVAGLWHAEVVAVLFQPAVFGVTLAAITAWIDGQIQRRRQRPAVLDLATPEQAGLPPQEFTTEFPDGVGDRPATEAQPAGVGVPAPPPVGSEDFTAIRGPGLIPPPESTTFPQRAGSPA